jgi:hypothetical protein
VVSQKPKFNFSSNFKLKMEEKVKISVDLMGGDNSPDKTLLGLDLFAKRNKNKNDYFFYDRGA